MKKLLTLLGILVISIATNAQLTVNQSVTPTTGLKVGDTISVKYTVVKDTTTPRYFWLRYQYNNKALAYISTTYSQGTSVQTYYTGWTAYKFTANTTNGKLATNLYEQYLTTPWGYATNADWNVGQLTIQRSDASVNGDIATQKYTIKDLGEYTNIHRLDLAYSINASSAYITPITTNPGTLSLSNVTGNTSQFKVRVLFPSGYAISSHTIQLMPLKSNGSGDIDWTKQPIAQKTLDASGEAIFTTEVKVGDSIGVYVQPTGTKTWMNNIITVSDAYKAFLGISQTDITGAANYFKYPALEKEIGHITIATSAFSESDSYYLFANVMGIDVTTKAKIPKSTTAATDVYWYTSLLNSNSLLGIEKYKVYVTTPVQTVDMVYAWGGDLDWSHSSHPDTVAARITSGIYTNSINPNEGSVKAFSTKSMEYAAPILEKATLSLTSTLVNGKVILSAGLTKADLAGLEVIMQYDSTKLTLTDVVFDAGSTITNFSTHNNGRLTFGSIDQLKTARIKVGTPYKLIFTPKETLTNTAGLFYTVLSDAIDAKGNKIELIVE
jgi:hypothetical protein